MTRQALRDIKALLTIQGTSKDHFFLILQFPHQMNDRRSISIINRFKFCATVGETEERGFPGMIGSIDCMHWEWKNCLVSWKGQYTRASGKPTIVLEAVASYDLWIWHAFFGLPDCLFASYQEHYRKDVERAFGVLQARFAIVKNPALSWDKNSNNKQETVMHKWSIMMSLEECL
ncbi:unnamed protein product [Microthlaspi erraticum]|uniref:Uncharacterized protein n=1 Tax=Microthlaspi erraticum TaxID=1685480 RepID=A0A6D2IQF8_9BRAS|nr:unnamed protein product [Microthlaspi erraticum]